MAYLLLLTLLCLSLLLVMSSEGMHPRKQGMITRQNDPPQKKCLIIRPLTNGETVVLRTSTTEVNEWKVTTEYCAPTTGEKGLSDECSSKIGKDDFDMLVFDVLNMAEFRLIQRNLAIAGPDSIQFFVRSKYVKSKETGGISKEIKLLDFGKFIRNEYHMESYGYFVKFYPKDKNKVSYYGKINWKTKVGIKLMFKENGDTKYTFFPSFKGSISKQTEFLTVTLKKEYTLVIYIAIAGNSRGTFKPMTHQTTTPIDFEHNFKTDKTLQIALKPNYYWEGTK